ncbi:30S ribosomal protein S1 [Acidaminobacter sp. JC074]|uniref:30S ribosomal protein S1 n=1 Tax=Acidaminobacter sp. JC074 TaxID=2530199 RepID=UPI001F0D425D|nr:30S ribosomal protein S1 [Acidaminobacter sp. JC074]MCH4889171.1 30S ribosomal protein S1 [Acidaminobacter sp. JC074]
MTESMDAYMDEIEKSMQVLKKGDIVEGTVISANEDEVLVNVGSAMDGVVTVEELEDHPINPSEHYKEGDKITVLVIKADDGEGNMLLSKKRAEYVQVWDDFDASIEGNKTFKIKVKGAIKGGVTCELKGVRGFIPGSQLALNYVEDLESYVGEDLEVKAMEYNREKNSVVLSAKAVLAEKREQLGKQLYDSLTEGQIYTGTVTRLADFGAFVDIGGADGLIHVTELSWKRIKHPSDVVNVGDRVEVAVIKVDKESKRIGLRLNDVQDNPWMNMDAYYQEDDVVTGKVVRLASFGAFVELESGIDGLLHVSEISEERISKPADVLELGQEVEVLIIGIDTENQKMSFSMKALVEDEVEDFDEYLEEETHETTIGSLFKDKLKNLKL